MTLSGYFMLNSVFVLTVSDSRGSNFKDNCVKTNKIDRYYQQQKCRPMTLVSGNINYF